MKMQTYTRKGGLAVRLEKPFEKPVVVPVEGDKDVGRHAWADARFALDIMAEHGIFFSLLMPPEAAPKERAQALKFSETFAKLHQDVVNSDAPEKGGVKAFVRNITDQIKPFIEWKAKQGDAQRSGTLRTLVWPLFFDHTRHEAERWVRRLEQLAGGDPEFERKEVASFWNNIMEEHARFVAHLLDPDEYELIEKARDASEVFQSLDKGGVGGVLKAAVKKPGTVAKSLAQNPETDAILSAAETILDFKTRAARDIEAARIKSIIDPRLADHVRREALKFVDELKRAV